METMTKHCFYAGHIDASKSWCACYALVRYIVPIQWPIYANTLRLSDANCKNVPSLFIWNSRLLANVFAIGFCFDISEKKARTVFVYVWWMLRLIVHRLECSFVTNPISKFEWFFLLLLLCRVDISIIHSRSHCVPYL